MGRRANLNWYVPLTRPRDPGRRPELASAGGPAGKPTGKRRDTKRRKRKR